MKDFYILFCCNPFNEKTADPDFEEEFNAAKECGATVLLFSFEILTKEKDAIMATRRIRKAETPQIVVYRGWMLTPGAYALLYDCLLVKNYYLINTPSDYKNCHYLPSSYQFIQYNTPKTVWVALENNSINFEKIFDAIRPFGNGPLVVKDYVKSQKYYWDTACFIPDASDREHVKSVIQRFIQLQGADINEGIVLREFVELNDLTVHAKSGMPLKQEYRLFYFYGTLLGCWEYWDEGQYLTDDKPPLVFFQEIAKKINSRFFCMDVAKLKGGGWIIIELGDGQVAGLPERADKNQFYKALS